MTRSLSKETLGIVSSLVEERLGLSFPPAKYVYLERAFNQAAKNLGFPHIDECISWFVGAPASEEFIGTMASYLTVGETYFYREEASFKALETTVLPEILKSHKGGEKKLRIWSAGCATGEEPYSIAMSLHSQKQLLKDWKISILATDINPLSLLTASQGMYKKWAFRNFSPALKKEYFTEPEKGVFKLNQEIRDMIQFSHLNLAQEGYPLLAGGNDSLDIIFCRNVLMYFAPEKVEAILNRFRSILLDGGWLFVSAYESSNLLSNLFTSITSSETILYRKAKPQNSPMTIDALTPIPSAPPSPTIIVSKKHNPKVGSYTPLALLCRDAANKGDHQEALTLTERAIRADKLNPALYCLKASILEELGDLDNAVEVLQQALYIDQHLAMVHFTLGNIALRRDKQNEAKDHFTRALGILDHYEPGELILGSDGMPAQRLADILRATVTMKTPVESEV